MNKKFQTDIKYLRNAIETNKLVVFAGAGISIDAGVPNWGTLIEEMSSEIELPSNEKDYLKIAQMYYNERQQKEYIEKVRTVLKHKKVRHNEIHEEIFQLNPEHILTTNYEDLLEQVIRKNSLPYSLVTKDSHFPYALNTHLLVKIHGDLEGEDFVLKEDDYINYSLKHPLVEGFIQSMFASKVILFVGYSFSDINLKMIVEQVRNILEKDFQNAYLLSVDDNFHSSQREYLKKKGINVITYDDADTPDGNYIKLYLDGRNALNKVYFKKGENLSLKGQKLLNLLNFIANYDKFNEPLTERNLIDQLYLSIKRFSEFTSLPPTFVANLFPFNNSTQYVYTIEGYSLETTNHKLYDLFLEQVVFENGELKFRPPSGLNLSERQIEEYENKLKEIVNALNHSLIFYLHKKNDRTAFTHREQHIQLRLKHEKCNCLNCKYRRLELAEVLKEALNISVNETSVTNSDMQIGYINYKLGNFKQACIIFEEVANKSWQTGKYFTYYIAKHNIKTLRGLVNFYEQHLKQEEKQKLLKVMEDIDFDRLLFQIPYIGESEYELLKMIRDDTVLSNAEDVIKDTVSKIIEVYDGYKNETTITHFSPTYHEIIKLELLKIITFYTNNYIVIDAFSNFKKVCNMAIDGLLISYATKKEYSERLKELDEYFFDTVLAYGDSSAIKKTFKKYEIGDLLFSDTALREIILTSNNFLKSFFEPVNFVGVNSESNKLMDAQITSGFFQDVCKNKFNNLFLILSKIELQKEKTNGLIDNLIAFLEHETFLWGDSIDYLSAFLVKNAHLIFQEQVEKILSLTFRKQYVYYMGETFIRALSAVIHKNKLNKISNKQLINPIDKDSRTIFPFWSISDDKIKEDLERQILEMLDKKFEIDLYLTCALNDAIDFNKYFDKYIAEVNRTKNADLGEEEFSVNYINAMVLINEKKVDSNDVRLQALTDLNDCMKFYLSPETFNYNLFKGEWLLLYPRIKIILERFAKVDDLKKAVLAALKENYNPKIADIYINYLLKGN